MNDIESILRAGSRERSLPDIGAAAANAGLLDVAYATEPSPVGPLLIAQTKRGLVRVCYLNREDAAGAGSPGGRGGGGRDGGVGLSEDRVLADLAAKVSPRILEAPARLDAVRRELDEFFAGRRRSFDLPLDWRLTDGFARRVLQATAAIPYGQVASYAEIADAAGSPRAYRAAGTALGSNPLPIVVPCHRVLHTGGGLGGYAGGLQRKRLLLAIEAGR